MTVKKALFEVIFEQCPERKEGAGHEKTGGKSFQVDGEIGQSRSPVGRRRPGVFEDRQEGRDQRGRSCGPCRPFEKLEFCC